MPQDNTYYRNKIKYFIKQIVSKFLFQYHKKYKKFL